MTNFNNFKTATAVKNEARKISFEMIRKFFIEELGEENVSEIGSNEIAVCLGTKDLTDGTTAEVCVSIKPTAKDYESRKTTKKTFEAFERIVEEEAWEMECKEKSDKKAKAEAEKAKKKAEGKMTKSKAEKQAELAKREAELDEAAKRVKEKRDKETAEIYAKAKSKTDADIGKDKINNDINE